MSEPDPSSRRDFLSGRSLRSEIEQAAARTGEAILDQQRQPPASGPTVRLATRAMATDFSVILNHGPQSSVETWFASDALDLIHRLEDQMTVYREHSELIDINRRATSEAVPVEPRLFELLKLARNLSLATNRACDPTAQRLVSLWRQCRAETRLPLEEELQAALALTGSDSVEFDDEQQTVRFQKPGLELNLNCIGKGAAVDRAAEVLLQNDVTNFVIQGGHSSVLARGTHQDLSGWPVGITNPLFPEERLGTVLLCDRAMGTSGSAVQFFRVQGRRFGHIIDPRTGWPVDHLMSATVLAPTAAEADALSTAFFVLGPAEVEAFCATRPDVAAILIPPPKQGRSFEPILIGIAEDDLFLN